jgi:hypothetical protein
MTYPPAYRAATVPLVTSRRRTGELEKTLIRHL